MPFGCGLLIAFRYEKAIGLEMEVTNAFRLRAADRRSENGRRTNEHAVTNAFRLRAADRHEGGQIICIYPITSPMPFGCGLLIAATSRPLLKAYHPVTNAFRLRAADRRSKGCETFTVGESPMPFGCGLLIARKAVAQSSPIDPTGHQCLSAAGC